MAFGDKRVQKNKIQEEESKTKAIEINAEMNGTLSFKEPVNLKINGHFSGQLDVRGALTIGSRATVESNINGDYVVIAGQVKGKVEVSKMLTLLPTAVLLGDIHTPKLNIVEGAVFQGCCHMTPVEVSDWMDASAVSSYLELDEESVMGLVRENKIPFVQEGDVLKFERSKIDDWAAQGMVN